MGMFDIFRKKEKMSAPLTNLKIGDWVTQYSSGFWKIVGIFPKYADEDYSYNGKSWKKGDRIGDWVILKKGFTAKMKPTNACELADAQWCNSVSDEVLQLIEATFAENPKARAKFDNAPDMPAPAVNGIWMALSNEQAESFANMIVDLPKRFTLEEFWQYFANYRQYVVKPPQYTHILYLYSYLWEISDSFDQLYFSAEIKKIDTDC